MIPSQFILPNRPSQLLVEQGDFLTIIQLNPAVQRVNKSILKQEDKQIFNLNLKYANEALEKLTTLNQQQSSQLYQNTISPVLHQFSSRNFIQPSIILENIAYYTTVASICQSCLESLNI